MMSNKDEKLKTIYVYILIFQLHVYIILMNWLKLWFIGIKDSLAFIEISFNTDGIMFLTLVCLGISAWWQRQLPLMTWDRKLLLAVTIIWFNFMLFWNLAKPYNMAGDVFILIYLGFGCIVILISWIFIYQQVHKDKLLKRPSNI